MIATARENGQAPLADIQNSNRAGDISSELGTFDLSRKKPSVSHPLVHHGRHFGRTIYAMCNMNALLTSGLLRATDEELSCVPDDELTVEERQEKRIFRELQRMIPGFEATIANSSGEDLRKIADLLQKGVSSARSDDTKSLKGAVLDWITPRGVPLVPPLARHMKVDRGFNHEVTGSLLCPANLDWSDPEIKAKLCNAEYIVPGDQWPVFLYKDYCYDPSDPWSGLLRSEILVQAYKHIFTSPSSVDKDPKATWSGNARIHGMTKVTIASLAYVATQLRFSLTSSSVFLRSDTVNDSQRFYNSIIEFLEEPDEAREVQELLKFWNKRIFPEHCTSRRVITRDSALAKLKERRARIRRQIGEQGL